MLFFNAHPVVIIIILEALLCLYAIGAAINATSKFNRIFNIVVAVMWIVFGILNAVTNL